MEAVRLPGTAAFTALLGGRFHRPRLAAFLGGTYHGFAQQFHPFLHDMASRWVLFALALSALAAGVQYGRWALHAHFNHNDLYHVIQIGAMVLFYKAGKLLRDARQMP